MEDLARLRRELHKKIQNKLYSLNFCTHEGIVEDFKRTFLWDNFSIETSKSLDVAGLDKVAKAVESVTTKTVINALLLRFNKYVSPSDVQRCTPKQIDKIKAIAVYRLGMSNEGMFEYFGKSVNRKTHLFNLTISEADHIIKRLERWEAKESQKKRSA